MTKEQPMTPVDIYALRESLGLTQEQLARKLGVTSTTVSRWERGISVPHRREEARMERMRLPGV